MILCNKCNGRMFIERQFSSEMHIETSCIRCGTRKFYHPPSQSRYGQWLLDLEKLRAKNTMTSL